MSGKSGLKENLLQKRIQIANDFQQIDKVDQRLGHTFGTSSSWQNIKSVWMQLERDAYNDNAKHIFKRHTALITKVLGLIKDVSDQSNISYLRL